MNRALRIHDPLLFWLSMAATVLGMLFVYDAGYARALASERGLIPPEFKSQLIFMVPAMIGAAVFARVSPEAWKKGSKLVWLASLILLIAVEVIGVSMNGAKRWVMIGPIAFQPAEFTKIATIIYLAGAFADRKAWPKKMPKRSFAQWMDAVAPTKFMRALPAVWVLVAVGLIEHEPDLGTAAVVAATAFAMFVPGGVTWKSIVAALALSGLGAGIMIAKQPYRLERITNHVHRWENGNADDIGFQTVQSEAAMASGGWFGVGIGNGRAKHILPATTTDFIMATIGEEVGVVGSLFVLGLIGAIVWRLKWLASKAADRFSSLVLFGTAAWIGIQACVNVMMANGFLPAIGIPLPFISSGGSSLVALWLALGLCQSVLAPRPEPAEKEEAREADRDRWGHGRARLSRA
ncbi:MAG: FtsW/RodA/SpoVE family cell cycle protein [Fimbriimonas sp.]